jgi:sugar O-acyltransferase (sialic acid O-acetyltransferase NeuD family)
MSRAPLVIWGVSGHSRVIADIVQLRDELELAGYIADPPSPGAEVLGGRDALPKLRARGIELLFIAVGDCAARHDLAAEASELGFRFPTLIHPSAVVARDALIGAGTVIAAGAIICPGARVGAQAIVNTAASVDHDCEIGDAVHVSPGVRLAGNVRVGKGTWIGIGASVIEKRTIGEWCVVGAGSVVVRDLPDRTVAYGVPARVHRRFY